MPESWKHLLRHLAELALWAPLVLLGTAYTAVGFAYALRAWLRRHR